LPAPRPDNLDVIDAGGRPLDYSVAPIPIRIWCKNHITYGDICDSQEQTAPSIFLCDEP